MIAQQTFDELFTRMTSLCGLSVKPSYQSYYFTEFEDESVEVIEHAFELMIRKPPSKLTKAAVVNAISMSKKDQGFVSASPWNGAPCSETDCIDGLVITKHRGNSYIWKCQSCRSYNNKNYAWFTPENVDDLERKLSKQFDVKPDFPVEKDMSKIVFDVSKNTRQENRKDLV